MDTCIRNHFLTVNTHFFIQILVKLFIDVFNYGYPAGKAHHFTLKH